MAITNDYIEALLAESDLTHLAFTIVERFSTQRPLNDVLVTMFQTIGASLQVWTEAAYVMHVFSNPDLNQSHVLHCQPEIIIGGENLNNSHFTEHQVKPDIAAYGPEHTTDSWKIKSYRLPKDQDNPTVQVSLPEKVRKNYSGGIWVSQFDFANLLPLGQFCVSWFEEPNLADRDLQRIQSALWSLAKSVSIMLNNHFPIHRDTYLPSYGLDEEKNTAILFADVRNSTPMFEISRLGGPGYFRSVESLLKIWLEYAADLISAAKIGNLHRFTGDGMMATFGEYEIGSPEFPPDYMSCALALHAAKHLVESFQELHKVWFQHEKVQQFYLDYNEDVELRLGIGINYGKVKFSYFGAPCSSGFDYLGGGSGSLYPGHLEYTAIGDHVNTASRLEGIASKLAWEVDLLDRGLKFRDQFRINSIVVSQTVSNRIGKFLDDIPSRRGIVNLKGKGIAIPFYEIDPKEVVVEKYRKVFPESPNSHYLNALFNPPDIKQYVHELEEMVSGDENCS